MVIKERPCTLQCGRAVYEITCTEIQETKSQDTIKYLIIPEFLIPRRPYPIYVYLYGIILYSTNPKMGQREAAEQTRKRFGLETFSHTTLGRAMKKLEALIKTFGNNPEQGNEAKEAQPGPQASSPNHPSSQGDCCAAKGKPEGSGRFPTAESNSKKKGTVIAYLKEAAGQGCQLTQELLRPQPPFDYKRPPYIGAFIDACHRIVGYTFIKYRSLLL